MQLFKNDKRHYNYNIIKNILLLHLHYFISNEVRGYTRGNTLESL